MKNYKIKYSIEFKEEGWKPEISEADDTSILGVRVLASDPDFGYTDDLALCSILYDDDDGLPNFLWMLGSLPKDKHQELLESLIHHLEIHE